MKGATHAFVAQRPLLTAWASAAIYPISMVNSEALRKSAAGVPPFRGVSPASPQFVERRGASLLNQ
jgi:hypothetical protein